MRGRPVVVQAPRRGPGLLGTMAQTAVIAGTATATSRVVSGAMSGGQQQKAAQQQAQMDAAAQQPVAAPAPTGLTDDKIAQLTKLAELQKAGVLTEEEFTAQKAKILAS